jgi:hypothetical protein
MKMTEGNEPKGTDTDSLNCIDVSPVNISGPSAGQLKTIG